MGERIELERIAGHDVEATRIARCDLRERGDGAVVALDCDHSSRALGEQCPRQSAGAGADLDHVDAVERAGRAGDAGGEVEIEEKVLAERFSCSETVPADHLAQRREIIEGAHQGVYGTAREDGRERPDVLRGLWPRRGTGRRSASADRRAASSIAAIRLARIGAAGAGDVERGTVVGRGAHEWKTERRR